MTQHQKYDYSVTPEIFSLDFVHLFGRVMYIIVLIFSEITLRIRNWHNVKL